MLPHIGLTADYQERATYSKYPWYALRKNYVDPLLESACVPFILPYSNAHIRHYLDRLDGLIIPGGGFDISPHVFGEQKMHPSVTTCEIRTAFELSLTQEALSRKMPILGICGGAQLLNVALGGTLIQHIPDAIEASLAHEQPNPRHEPGHAIDIVSNTLLAEIAQTATAPVNSAHHQAVDTLGQGLRVNANASDGVIEGIELENHPFCIGVQWHPEFLISDVDNKLFKAFVEACSLYAQKKSREYA